MSQFTGIRCADPDALRQRVLLSETTQTTDRLYEPQAVVPASNTLWRPNAAELEPFLATETTPTGGTVEVVQFTVALRKYLTGHPGKISATVCAPDQLTTTENTRNANLRTGLHLDSKEARPVSSRLESQRRIGLNFGPGKRYLLLGSVDALSLSSALGKPETHEPNTGDVRSYQARHAAQGDMALHCLWLELQCGEAYFAPTEVCTHDGSTYGVSEPSTIQFWIGAPVPGSFGTAI